MKYPINIASPPSERALSLESAKSFFREDRSIEDVLIYQFISAAQRSLEHHTGYVLIDTGFTMHLRSFEDVKIPKLPLKSGSVSIGYAGESGTPQTLNEDLYEVHEVEQPPEIEFKSGLPNLGDKRYPVTVSFTAGYGTSATDVPDDWKSMVGMVALVMWSRDIPKDSFENFNPLDLGVVRSNLNHYSIGQFK